MESCLCSHALRSASFSGREADLGVACPPVQQQLLRSSFVALMCCESQGSFLHRGLPRTAADCLASPSPKGQHPRAALHDKGWLAHATGASRCSGAIEGWQAWDSSPRASASNPRLAAKASAGTHRASPRSPPQGHSTRVTDGAAAASSARHTSSRRRCTGSIHSGHSGGHSDATSSSSSSSSHNSSGGGHSSARWPFLFSDDLLPSSGHSPKRRPRSRPGPSGSGTSAHAHALLEGSTATAIEAWIARNKALGGGCVLETAAYCQPHPTNGGRGDGDAHLIEGNWVGVADGIRGWAEQGVNAGLYCQELLWNCAESIRGSGDFSDSDRDDATARGSRGRRQREGQGHAEAQALAQGLDGYMDMQGLSDRGAGAFLPGPLPVEGSHGGLNWEEGPSTRERQMHGNSGPASTSGSYSATNSTTNSASSSSTGSDATGSPSGSSPSSSPGKKKRGGGRGRRGQQYLSQAAKSPKEVLEEGHMRTELQGSCTATLATLQGEHLSIANVGDSGFLLVRDGEIVARSVPMQHGFDAPFQIGFNVGDNPTCAMEYDLEVVPGDVLVLGTDGLLDNLFPIEIALIVGEAQGDGCGPEAVAKRLATAAFKKSQGADSFTPFGEGARAAGRPHVGGKADDITALVAFIH